MHKSFIQTVAVSALLASAPAMAVSKKELNRRLQLVEAASSDYQGRLGKLEKSTNTQIVMDMLQRVEQLQVENAELRGLLEEQQNEVERLRQRQRELYLDVDRRLNDVQPSLPSTAAVDTPSGVSAASAMSAGSAVLTPAATATAATAATAVTEVKPAPVPAVASISEERKEYESAFNLLREGRHDDAIAAFQAYLRDYPDGRYPHNAQYWMGEANYITHRYDRALVDFQKVLDNYPDSNKVADANLKLGYTYYELKDYAKARSALVTVVKQFPTSKAAFLAEKRLLTMGSGL